LETGETTSMCTLLLFYNHQDAAKPDAPIPPRVTDRKQSSRRRNTTPIAQPATKRTRFSDMTQTDATHLAPMTTPLMLGSYVPLATAGLKEIRVQALVDSGTDYSVVCDALLLRAFGRLWLDKNVTQPENSPRFWLGDGQMASAMGLARFPVELSGKEFQVQRLGVSPSSVRLHLGGTISEATRAVCAHGCRPLTMQERQFLNGFLRLSTA
jgi:hypothetical protein